MLSAAENVEIPLRLVRAEPGVLSVSSMERTPMNRALPPFLASFLVLAACQAAASPSASPSASADLPSGSKVPASQTPGARTTDPAELILHGGRLITMDPDQPEAEALAIGGDRILAIGTDAEIHDLAGPDTTLGYLGGRTVLPGFIDSHSHRFGDWEAAGYGSPEEALHAGLEQGWTTISEHFASAERLQQMVEMDGDGRLPLDINAYLPLNWQDQRFGDWYLAYRPGQQLSPHVRVAGVKVFVDSGDPGEKALTEPYANRADYRGRAFFSQDELSALVAEAHRAGFQVSAHTGGDAAHDLILNAYEQALDGDDNSASRHRIEHVMVLRDDQLERMRRLGIVASIQLSWFNSDWAAEFEEGLGPDRLAWVGRWRDLVDAGVLTIGSTDTPWGIGTVGPAMRAVSQAVTRIGEGGSAPPDWMLDQRLDVRDALELITIDAAFGSFEEEHKGSLTAGKLADLVILSENPLTVAPEALEGIEVLMTIVGGRSAYCAPQMAEACP